MFKTAITAPGSHALTVRLAGGDDPLSADDESSRAVEVTAALPVLLVDGEPGREPLSSETDFLLRRAGPRRGRGPPGQGRGRPARRLRARIAQGEARGRAGERRAARPQAGGRRGDLPRRRGGVLFAPGDRTDAAFANDALHQSGEGWLPAKLGAIKGDASRRSAVAHPSPRTFTGPALSPFGQGDDPTLAGADLFAYRVLEPAKGASVPARLDTGDPWVVERPYRKGRVAILAGPVDAEGGTLPVNPDFVPWAHELIFHLADADEGARTVRPGEPIVVDLDPATPASLTGLVVETPSGAKVQAEVVRADGGVKARLDDTAEPGLYRVRLPDPPGGSTYVAVAADGRESDPRPLEPAEAETLSKGWPLAFESESARLAGRLFAADGGRRHEIWRYLVLAALGGLCVEVWLTRQLVKARGIADAP